MPNDVATKTRPPGKLTLDFPGDLMHRLRQYCSATDRPQARVIRRAISEYLDRENGALKPTVRK